MNPLEKALLVKEISLLVQQLAEGSLSYFETAKHKQRLKDIVDVCDTPLLNQQIFGERSHIKPFAEAEVFIASSNYSDCCAGVFKNDRELENHLHEQLSSSWALLFHDRLGWQIWMIEIPNYTLLISDWGKLEDVYAWMIEEQKSFPCLKSNQNEPHKRKYLSEPVLKIPTLTHVVETAPMQVPVLDTEIIAPVMTQPEHPSLVLNEHIYHLIPLNFENHTEKLLFRLQPEQSNHRLSYIDLLAYYVDLENILQRPIYLAEQINLKGQFIKYLALFGAQNDTQAIRMAQSFSHQQQYSLACVRKIDWTILQNDLFELETFFSCFGSAEILWRTEQYYPFIPTEFINKQKFIQFDESPANFKTPIILLKERQKIRIIHGKNRVALSKAENAYPYIMLDRQQGISWKIIQDTVQKMQQPIRPLQLYESIQQHITA